MGPDVSREFSPDVSFVLQRRKERAAMNLVGEASAL
jgi:hypothetical protein